MELEKIQSRIRKLKRMAATIGPEADNAKRIIQTLIDKYNLDPNEVLEERTNRRFRVHRLKKYAIMLAGFCKLPCYALQGFPDYISIEADPDEYKMFFELLGEIRHQFNKKERELSKRIAKEETKMFFDAEHLSKWKNDSLRSFMIGYMEGNFPRDVNLCNLCGKGHIVDMICNYCGKEYKTSKYHQYGLNEEQYSQGKQTNTKSISQDKKRIGYNG